ncbi:MAG TPA: hypothetical protein VE999_19460 [Gemmataceae bacterium]|jgi:hypothetical protein|nr:hypothetical protein [Gemmataceae bacterium]
MAKQKAKLSKAAITRRRNLAKRRSTPLGRLVEDGCSNREHIRRRLQWLAYVLQLPAETLPRIGNNPSEGELAFLKRHHISVDWFIGGDLQGLRRTLAYRKAAGLPFWRSVS